MSALLFLLAANILLAFGLAALALVLVRAAASGRGFDLLAPAMALGALLLMDGAASGLGVYRLRMPMGAFLALPLFFGLAPLIAAYGAVAVGGPARRPGDVLRGAGPLMLLAVLLLLPFWLLPMPEKLWLLRGWITLSIEPDQSHLALAGLLVARGLLIGQGLFYLGKSWRSLRAAGSGFARPMLILLMVWLFRGVADFLPGEMAPRIGDLALGLGIFASGLVALSGRVEKAR
ncbi:MAG: hypothetical protein PW790_00710 [Parvibaculaceae bacterium]|nr:hypothetical protein [Parvibaculaceae bacterium]